MEYDQNKKELLLDRELGKLDKFVIEFCKLLGDYVIVSGYVSILLGRSRATEDIDLLVPEMRKEDFFILWKRVHDKGFECLNTSKPEQAFNMLSQHAIRFFKKIPIPNVEFKIIKNDLDRYSFDNKIEVIIRKDNLYISPIELQIAYKLFLGSEKDLEDAKHLYNLFMEKLNKEELLNFVKKLRVEDKFKLIK